MNAQTAYPKGVTVAVPDSINRKARQAIETDLEIRENTAKLGKLKIFFKIGETGALVKVIAKRAKALARAVDLAKEFRIVQLDENLKRKVLVADRWEGEHEISVPFIFTSRLPAKRRKSYTVIINPRQRADEPGPFIVRRRRRGWFNNPNRPRRFTASALVPVPQDAALEALQKHGARFDYTEVWWVPKDVRVKERNSEPADPIVVGVIEAPRKDREPERFCFELYRWEQPDLENPYFAHEAY